MARGRFIVFEGGEGAGKSTQARLLAENLTANGIDVTVTREPGGTPFAEDIRRMLLSGSHAGSGPEAEAILVSAGRIDHLDAIIRPALESGRWVICDRFTDSTRAYQGVLSGGDEGFIAGLVDNTVGETRPDLTIVIDVPPETAAERLAGRSGHAHEARWDEASSDDFATLRNAFLGIASANPANHAVVDGTGEADAVAAQVWAAVTGHFRLGAS